MKAGGSAMPMHIRPEAPGDAAAIAGVVERAFATHPLSTHTEQTIVRSLREAGALSVSLVAEQDRRVVGHIAFSAVRIGDGAPGWYGLGPLAVEPALQRQGIGTALVEAGLERLRALAAAGCVVVGSPAYYGRFGFGASGLTYPGVPARNVMARVFAGKAPSGEVAYHAAFDSEA